MSLLHSFYCWGAAAVILGSTLFFALFGLDNWRILTLLWALVLFATSSTFCTAPLTAWWRKGTIWGVRGLLRLPLFWLLILLMVCSGAAEAAMASGPPPSPNPPSG